MLSVAETTILKGFPAGRTASPRAFAQKMRILEKRYGRAVRVDVLDTLATEAVSTALREHSLRAVAPPVVEWVQDKEGLPLKFSADLEIYPDIAVNLSDLSITKQIVQFSKEDLEFYVKWASLKEAKWAPVNRPIQKGDGVKLDYVLQIQGTQAPQEHQKGVFMEVDENVLFSDFIEALLQATKGEKKAFPLQYPPEWEDDVLAGQLVDVCIKVREVMEKVPLSEAELAEKWQLPVDDKVALYSEAEKRAQHLLQPGLDEQLREAVLEQLLKANPLEIPEALLNQEKRAIIKEWVRAQRERSEVEEPTPESIEEMAKHRVELGLLLNAVIRQCEIRVDPKRVRANVEALVAPYGEKAYDMLARYYDNEHLLHTVQRSVLLDQAVEELLSRAKITEEAVPFQALKKDWDAVLGEHKHD